MLVSLIWVIIRYNGVLLVFYQESTVVLTVRWYERKLGKTLQVHNVVQYSPRALLWEKVGRHKMVLFTWKSDTHLSNGISVVFPRAHPKSSTACRCMKHKPDRIPSCVNISWHSSQ